MLPESSGPAHPGSERVPHGYDRAVIRTISWYLADEYAAIEPGDTRLVTLAIRCVGPLSFLSEMALGFEVIGIDAAETVPVLTPVE